MVQSEAAMRAELESLRRLVKAQADLIELISPPGSPCGRVAASPPKLTMRTAVVPCSIIDGCHSVPDNGRGYQTITINTTRGVITVDVPYGAAFTIEQEI